MSDPPPRAPAPDAAVQGTSPEAVPSGTEPPATDQGALPRRKLPPPRPPRPAPLPFRREGPGVAGLTLRVAALATAASLVLIFLQMNRIGTPVGGAPSARGAPAASADPLAVSVAALPEPGGEPATAPGSMGAAAPGAGVSGAGTSAPGQVAADPRLVRFHGLLDGVADFEDIAQNRAYAALAEHVRRLTDEEAARILRTDLDFSRLLQSPGLARGEMVRADGLLVRLEPVRLVPGAGPPGVEDAWRGWLVELDGDGCYVFDFVGLPVEVSTRDVVRVEGAFLKLIRYENRGGATRDAPFLIARRAFRHVGDEAPRPFRYDYVAVVLIAVIGVGVIVQRKRAADDRTLFEARREGRMGRGHTRTGNEPPRDA